MLQNPDRIFRDDVWASKGSVGFLEISLKKYVKITRCKIRAPSEGKGNYHREDLFLTGNNIEEWQDSGQANTMITCTCEGVELP